MAVGFIKWKRSQIRLYQGRQFFDKTGGRWRLKPPFGIGESPLRGLLPAREEVARPKAKPRAAVRYPSAPQGFAPPVVLLWDPDDLTDWVPLSELTKEADKRSSAIETIKMFQKSIDDDFDSFDAKRSDIVACICEMESLEATEAGIPKGVFTYTLEEVRDSLIQSYLDEMEEADRFDNQISAAECAIMEMEKLTDEDLAKYPCTLEEVHRGLAAIKGEYLAWRRNRTPEERREARERAESRSQAQAEREAYEALVSGCPDDDDDDDEDEEW